jgi:hypothetical protein
MMNPTLAKQLLDEVRALNGLVVTEYPNITPEALFQMTLLICLRDLVDELARLRSQD